MSKIGKRPIDIPEGTTISATKDLVEVKGQKGTQVFHVPEGIKVKLGDGKINVSLEKKDQNLMALYGLTRATLANMVLGVSKGFEKTLELVGVGFRASLSGDELTLTVGFSHPLKVKAPPGISFSISEGKMGALVTVSGIDKQLVGQVAARIRSIRPPEPYKGKGIRYLNETVRKKPGKAAKTVGIVVTR